MIIAVGKPVYLFAVDSSYVRSTKRNPATEIIVENMEFTVGNYVTAGYYDIIAHDEVIVGPYMLREGTVVKAEQYTTNNKINVEGKVTLMPATFEPLSMENNKYEISMPGHYVVGQEIAIGEYEISMVFKDSYQVNIAIAKEGDSATNIISWNEKIPMKPVKVNLIKGTTVSIFKTDSMGFQIDEPIILKRLQ